jgi:hypothetical protein
MVGAKSLRRLRVPVVSSAVFLLATAVLLVLQGCSQGLSTNVDGTGATRGSLSASTTKLSLDLCDPAQGGFSLVSTNAFFPIQVGQQWRFEGEEDGALIELLITVLDETETVAGVNTRVIEEREWEDGELIEVSRNFFAQAADSTVCYFGEAVDIFEDGEIVSHEGAWRADEPGNGPGIFMPANPRPGMRFQMEVAPGIAEDEGKIVGVGPVTVLAGRFTDTIRVQESNPLDGSKGDKVYARNVGLVVDGPVELVSFTSP